MSKPIEQASTFVKRVKFNFTMMPNEVLNCESLTWKAKGIFAYMLSRPDGWKFYRSQLSNVSKDNKDAVNTAIKELVDHGLLSLERAHSEKGFRASDNIVLHWPPAPNEMNWYLEPKTENPFKDMQENPSKENPSLIRRIDQQEGEENKNPLPPKGDDPVNEIVRNQIKDAWNLMAKDCGLSQVRELTPQRIRVLNTRLKDPVFVKGWKEAIARIPSSDFLCGRSKDREWRADFTWFIKPESVLKIIEGKYHWSGKPGKGKDNDPLNDYTV